MKKSQLAAKIVSMANENSGAICNWPVKTNKEYIF